MDSRVRKSASAYRLSPMGRPRFQHWYRGNQVYFITARRRARFKAFASEEAKAIFWRQFDKYTAKHEFAPWVTSLLDHHYHTIGYLKVGADLAPMMNGIQGSVSKLVNDVLESQHKASGLQAAAPLDEYGRLVPFWYDSPGRNYFDGCLRDELQATRTYRYVLTQCKRHGICADPRDYPHAHIRVPLEIALPRATQLEAFLYGVPYKRYAHD